MIETLPLAGIAIAYGAVGARARARLARRDRRRARRRARSSAAVEATRGARLSDYRYRGDALGVRKADLDTARPATCARISRATTSSSATTRRSPPACSRPGGNDALRLGARHGALGARADRALAQAAARPDRARLVRGAARHERRALRALPHARSPPTTRWRRSGRGSCSCARARRCATPAAFARGGPARVRGGAGALGPGARAEQAGGGHGRGAARRTARSALSASGTNSAASDEAAGDAARAARGEERLAEREQPRGERAQARQPRPVVADREDAVAAHDHERRHQQVGDGRRRARARRAVVRDQRDAEHDVRDRRDAGHDPVELRALGAADGDADDVVGAVEREAERRSAPSRRRRRATPPRRARRSATRGRARAAARPRARRAATRSAPSGRRARASPSSLIAVRERRPGQLERGHEQRDRLREVRGDDEHAGERAASRARRRAGGWRG